MIKTCYEICYEMISDKVSFFTFTFFFLLFRWGILILLSAETKWFGFIFTTFHRDLILLLHDLNIKRIYEF